MSTLRYARITTFLITFLIYSSSTGFRRPWNVVVIDLFYRLRARNLSTFFLITRDISSQARNFLFFIEKHLCLEPRMSFRVFVYRHSYIYETAGNGKRCNPQRRRKHAKSSVLKSRPRWQIRYSVVSVFYFILFFFFLFMDKSFPP